MRSFTPESVAPLRSSPNPLLWRGRSKAFSPESVKRRQLGSVRKIVAGCMLAALAAAFTCFDIRATISKDETAKPPATGQVGQRWPAPPAQSTPGQNVPVQDVVQTSAPSMPTRTEATVYDNWTVTCRDTVGANTKKVCSAALQIVDQGRNAVLFSWLIGRNAESLLMTVLQVPSSVFIQKGVELKIGNGKVRRLNYHLCVPQQCEAMVPMDDALNKELIASKAATATTFAVNGQSINFNVVLQGVDRVLLAMGP